MTLLMCKIIIGGRRKTILPMWENIIGGPKTMTLPKIKENGWS